MHWSQIYDICRRLVLEGLERFLVAFFGVPGLGVAGWYVIGETEAHLRLVKQQIQVIIRYIKVARRFGMEVCIAENLTGLSCLMTDRGVGSDGDPSSQR